MAAGHPVSSAASRCMCFAYGLAASPSSRRRVGSAGQMLVVRRTPSELHSQRSSLPMK